MKLKEMLDIFSEDSEEFKNPADTEEFLSFDLVNSKRSERPDLHALLLLNELMPGKKRILGKADFDGLGWVIELDINLNKLAKVINQNQVIELMRCGVFLNNKRLCFIA